MNDIVKTENEKAEKEAEKKDPSFLEKRILIPFTEKVKEAGKYCNITAEDVRGRIKDSLKPY